MVKELQPMVTFFAGTYPYQVRINLWYRQDYLEFECVGGTHPHVGAVAYGDEHVELLHQFPDHKEGELLRSLVKKAQKASGSIVVGSCGIHVDNATWEEIQLLVHHAERCGEELERFLLYKEKA